MDEQASISNLLLDAPTVDTLTAVRLVVDIVIAHGVDEVFDASNVINVGIGVSSEEAFNVGINGLPEPAFSDKYPPRGWLYVATKPVLSIASAGSQLITRQAEFSADLRSMRKIDKGILFMVVHNNAIFGTADVDIWGRVRVLCLT